VMEAIGRLRQGILDQPVDLWCAAAVCCASLLDAASASLTRCGCPVAGVLPRDWRAANHHDHDTLLAGIVNCPRITILYVSRASSCCSTTARARCTPAARPESRNGLPR
jgi:hypothetical protein